MKTELVYYRDRICSKSDSIRKYYSTRVSSADDIDDLVQEVICIVIEKMHALKSPESFDSWVYGIMKNVLKRYYAQKRKFQTEELHDSPVEDTYTDQICRDLLVADLPERLRLVHELFYVKRYKSREISRILKLSEGTIKFQLHDLRKRLKKIPDMIRLGR